MKGHEDRREQSGQKQQNGQTAPRVQTNNDLQRDQFDFAKIAAREAGQFTIEAILLMVIFLGISLALTRTAKESGFVTALVEGPWKPLQGMIEDGVWIPAGENSRAQHPSQLSRHVSDRPQQEIQPDSN